MADVVVTCPKWFWEEWIREGDPAGTPWSGEEWGFTIGRQPPRIAPGERVYVVALGRLRGFAPLIRVERHEGEAPTVTLVRGGGAEAVTIAERITGFRGFRYRWWRREDEAPFPGWRME